MRRSHPDSSQRGFSKQDISETSLIPYLLFCHLCTGQASVFMMGHPVGPACLSSLHFSDFVFICFHEKNLAVSYQAGGGNALVSGSRMSCMWSSRSGKVCSRKRGTDDGSRLQ